MRYYLASILSDQDRKVIRDNIRTLDRYKRNLEQPHLDLLHLNYKYLGKDLSKESIAASKERLENLISKSGWRTFTLEVNRYSLGTKSEYSPDLLKVEVKNTPELASLYRTLHQSLSADPFEEVIKRKDHNRLLGIVKLATLKQNVSNSDRKAIALIAAQWQQKIFFTIDNFTIIASELWRQKTIYKVIARIPLSQN